MRINKLNETPDKGVGDDDPTIWGRNHVHELLVFESMSPMSELL